MKTRLIPLTVALTMAGGVAQVSGADPATDLVCTGCVQATDLATNAVTAAKLRADSVTGAKILDGSVAAADLAADSVDASKITEGSVTLGDLGANSVDTSKIKDGTVGLADLASNSVNSTKIKNGSIAEADLDAALLARLAKMEADIAALKGGPYSNATFKGTYRCQTIEVVADVSAAEGWANIELASGDDSAISDGAGSVTFEGPWTTTGTGWNVVAKPTGGYKLGVWVDAPWDEDRADSGAYSVSADGRIDFGAANVDAWLSYNGDTVIIRTKPVTAGDGVTQNICVRTVGP
jgi:hypothetical protein